MFTDGAEVLKGGQFLRVFAFFKSCQCFSVWNVDRKGDALMEFNLSIEEAYGFGFTEAEAVEYLHGPLLEADIYTGVNAV